MGRSFCDERSRSRETIDFGTLPRRLAPRSTAPSQGPLRAPTARLRASPAGALRQAERGELASDDLIDVLLGELEVA